MRNGLPNFADEAAHAARLRDIMIYRLSRVEPRVNGEPVRLRLHDSGGIATVTLPPSAVVLRPDDTVAVTRATALAHGLGLPDEIRPAER